MEELTNSFGGSKQREGEELSVVIDAVCEYDLIFTHIFFQKAGSNNDINIVNDSPLLRDILKGAFRPRVTWRGFWYLLGDEIYPTWRWIVKTSSSPVTRGERAFSTRGCQKGYRAGDFGVVQSDSFVRKSLRTRGLSIMLMWLQNNVINILTNSY